MTTLTKKCKLCGGTCEMQVQDEDADIATCLPHLWAAIVCERCYADIRKKRTAQKPTIAIPKSIPRFKYTPYEKDD